MKFGVSTFVWVSPFTTHSFDLIYKIKEMGYDIIEVAVEDKDLIDWAKLKKITKELGLSVTISGAFGAERDISSDNADIRMQGLTYITDCIKIAAEMESPIFGRSGVFSSWKNKTGVSGSKKAGAKLVY